jgi:hypothetical protein
MTVSPNATLTVGSTQQMTAVGYDADGRVIPVSPTWSVVAGGTIASTGVFTAGSLPGVYAHTVVASVGGISANASITVIPGPLASIVVTPTPVTLAVTSTQQFVAVGKDAVGNIVPFTPIWVVVNATAGSINGSTGLFTAGTVSGTYTNTVQATSGGISGFATVNVTAGALASIAVSPNPSNLATGGTQTFTAVGKDANGNVVVIVPVWSVVNATAGSINGSTGLFTAGTVSGTYTNTVQATSGGISGFATVNVAVGALATITVSPNPSNLATGGTQTFTAVGKDANGNVVGIVPVWSVVNATAGSINSSTGLFTAGSVNGTYTNTVQATSGGISGFATVNVAVGALASITVSPNPSTLATGGLQTFTAVGKDANGNVVVITPTWAVGNPTAGSITSGTGVFTAGTVAGTYTNTVQATSGGVTGFATVIVVGPLASITVSPNPSNLAIRGTQTFTAVGKDANGNLVVIVPVWSVVNATAGSINSGTGLFTAGTVAGTYTNTVQATSGAISGFATVIVAGGPLASITVSPNPSNLSTGGTQPFTAVGKDANGNVVVIVPVWSVVNATAGSINSGTGLFTAGTVTGTYTNTVQATSGLVSGFATVIVAAAGPPPPLVDLGAATSAGILGATAITCGSGGTINADVMLSPGTAVDPACVITGTKHINDATAVQAQIDMNTAYNTLMGLPCPPANVESDLAGRTFTAGVYCTSAGSQLLATGGATLDGGGDPNATFVFQVGSALTTTGSINLIGMAQATNVYWVVGSSATIGGGGWQGNILAHTTITMNSATTLVGRALAHTGAVTIGTGNITLP